MANSGEIIVTRLRMYIDGNATKTTKRNAPGDKNYVSPFIDSSTCITNANPISPSPSPSPTPSPSPSPVAPTPTQCFYNSANISSTSHNDAQQACDDTTLTQAIRHDNSTASAFPATGNTVWTDCGTTTLADGFYKVDGTSKVMEVSGGSVVKVSDCSNVPAMPCQGKTGEVYLSAGRQSLGDFCGDTWTVNSLHNFDGSTLSQGLNQSICKNGRIIDGRNLYYIVSLNPYTADPDNNQISYWQIDSEGVVGSTGTYDGCTGGGGGNGGGQEQ
jgi:hypothetical protein